MAADASQLFGDVTPIREIGNLAGEAIVVDLDLDPKLLNSLGKRLAVVNDNRLPACFDFGAQPFQQSRAHAQIVPHRLALDRAHAQKLLHGRAQRPFNHRPGQLGFESGIDHLDHLREAEDHIEVQGTLLPAQGIAELFHRARALQRQTLIDLHLAQIPIGNGLHHHKYRYPPPIDTLLDLRPHLVFKASEFPREAHDNLALLPIDRGNLDGKPDALPFRNRTAMSCH